MRLLLLVQLVLVVIPGTTSYMAIWPSGRARPRNITAHPACVNDGDCAVLSSGRGEDYRCFQYMCYPWRTTDTAFRHCRRTSDCRRLQEAEGGLGEDGACWRHPDRRNVHSGICLDKK